MSPDRRSSRLRRAGRTAVETAIVINVLLAILLAVYEYGRLIMVKQLMDNAAREGARLAVVSTNPNSGVTTATIQSTVTGFLAGQLYNNLTINVGPADTSGNINTAQSWNTVPFGSNIGVQVTLTYVPIVPINFGLPGVMQLTSKSIMRSEAN